MDLSGGFNNNSGSITSKGKALSWSTDGNVLVSKGKVTTSGASRLTFTVNGDKLEVSGADLSADGIIKGGSVKLNGKAVEKNCAAGVDLSKLEGAVANLYKPAAPGFFRRVFRLG